MNKKTCPLISIITISLNSDNYLEQTIQSIISQTYPNIEYIIIDGGSADSTIDIINGNTAHITKWISEPDKGISDAMNKGIAMASGDYILFIHSDDYLYSDHSIQEALDSIDGSAPVYCFDVLFQSEAHEQIHSPSPADFFTNLKLGACHQGIICKRDLFQELGYFDINFNICMDYDFFLRVYRKYGRGMIKIIHQTLSVMRDTGISSRTDWKSLKKRFKEERKAHKNNCRYWFLFYPLYWSIYLSYRFIKSKLGI